MRSNVSMLPPHPTSPEWFLYDRPLLRKLLFFFLLQFRLSPRGRGMSGGFRVGVRHGRRFLRPTGLYLLPEWNVPFLEQAVLRRATAHVQTQQ